MTLSLSPRQQQVLGLLAAGMTTKEISAELSLDQTTVKVHAQRMRERLGALTNAQAVGIAVRAGVLK